MDTKALRQKILDLAIHGKLVPQAPNDEPASVLLQRIREEKERLVKEGKIKKSKKSAKTDETGRWENVPFEVSETWEWTTLNDIYNFIDYRGATPHKRQDGIPLITAKNVKYGYIDYTIKDFISNEEYEERKSRGISHKGDILFTTEAPLGNVALADKEFYSAGQRLITFQHYGNLKLSNIFFMYVMLSMYFKARLIENRTGSGVEGIQAARLKLIPLPIPPLAEQHRIVAEIERWFSLIDIIESGKANLQTAVKQAKTKILDLAIHGKLVPQDPSDEPAAELLRRINPKAEITSDNAHYGKVPFEVPETWEWTTLEEICSIKGGKRIPKGMSFSKEKTEHIYLRVTNMKLNTIVLDDLKYISNEVYSLIKNYTISSSDLYLTIAGTIGSVGIIPQEVDGMNLTENAAKLTNIACDKKYLLYALQSTVTQEHFTSKFHQVAQPKLSIETASSANIPLPPLAEQRRIVAKIDELFAQLDLIEAEL